MPDATTRHVRTPVRGITFVSRPASHVSPAAPQVEPGPDAMEVTTPPDGIVAADDASAKVAEAAPVPTTWTRGRVVVLALVVAYMLLVLVVPMGALVLEAFRQGARPLIDGVSSPAAIQALVRSVQLAVIAVIANGVCGIAAALVLVRQRFRGKYALDALIDITFAVSPVMTGLAFLLLFGRTGWFAPLANALHLQMAFAFPGLVVATIFVTLPFTAREISHVLAEVGDQEEQVAATLGATRWQTFWRVTLPNIRHALIVGVTLTAARALGEFGAVLVLGGAIAGKTQTATTFIYGASEERRAGEALNRQSEARQSTA